MQTANKFQLDIVFEELNDQKILSKQVYACCGNCGHYDLFKLTHSNRNYIGYCFYHIQGRDSASANGLLYLGFNSNEFYDNKDIAKIIVGIFKKHNFEIICDGTSNSVIVIKLPQIIIDKFNEDILKENEACDKENDVDTV